MSELDAISVQSLWNEKKESLPIQERQLDYVNDNNQGNYTNQAVTFNFTTLGLTSKMVCLDQAYLQIPLKISPAAGNFSAAPIVAFRDSILSLFNKVIIRGDDNREILNQTGDLACVNALRMLMEDTHDWIYCTQDELQAHKDSYEFIPKVTTGALGETDLKNPQTLEFKWDAEVSAGMTAPPYSAPVVGGRNIAYNPGFVNRNLALLTSAMKSDGTWDLDTTTNAVNTILRIPLRYIHPIFEQFYWPMINVHLELLFDLNIPSRSDYNPICSGKSASSVEAAATVAVNTTKGPCRLYYHSVVLAPEINERYEKMLKDGFQKTLSFPYYQIYRQFKNVTGTDEIQHDIVTGINGVRKVWLVTHPTGTPLNGPNWPSAMVTGPLGVRNANVRLNGTQYYTRNIDTPQEFWNMLREQFPIEGKDTAGRLTYDDFLKTHRIHCFDLTRPIQSVGINDPNRAMSVSVISSKTTAAACDFVYILELQRAVTLDISRGGVKVRLGAEKL